METLFSALHSHRRRYQWDPSPEANELFQRFLAIFTLHAAARPKRQVLAWTIHLQNPLLNLFLAADTDEDSVTGRFFRENVKAIPENRFYQEVSIRGGEVARSICSFHGSDPIVAAENYYAQSEQRPARFFQTGENSFRLLLAHPDCDVRWLRSLQQKDLPHLDEEETVVFMERRPAFWHCGCAEKNLTKILAPAFAEDPEALFAEEETLEMVCPRCAARHTIRREAVEAAVSEGHEKGSGND
ncbi:MAG: Hsp33 family molecular chaperone HslO [Opitutales bacterium]|nr:Hsp33 family molecular chaperone HslO [Opitutales bacterium]